MSESRRAIRSSIRTPCSFRMSPMFGLLFSTSYLALLKSEWGPYSTVIRSIFEDQVLSTPETRQDERLNSMLSTRLSMASVDVDFSALRPLTSRFDSSSFFQRRKF
jgi:hypothetical protein